MSEFSLSDLESIIARRADALIDASWTAKLLSKGSKKVVEKFGEEAVELVIAGVCEDNTAVKKEAADVLFHLLVLLKARGITVSDVMQELSDRTSQSGFEEKASRSGLASR